MGNKTLRGNTKVFVAYPEAFANRATPTVAELNAAAFVVDISTAVNDDYTMNRTDSDTDSTQSVADVASLETPTFDKYDVSLDIFSDADQTVAGVFNRARDLFKNKNIDFIVGKRIGVAQGSAFAANDVVSLYSVKTDNPSDIDAAGSPLQLGARFKPQGWVLTEYKVVS